MDSGYEMNTFHCYCKDILLPLHRHSGGKLRQWGRCTVSSGKQSGRQTVRPTQRAHVETAGRLTDQLFSSALGFPGTGNAARAVRAIIAVEKHTTLNLISPPHTKNNKLICISCICFFTFSLNEEQSDGCIMISEIRESWLNNINYPLL